MWQTSCIIHACAPLPFIFRLLLALCSFPLTFAFTFFVLLVCFYYLLAPLGCDFPSTCLASVANSRFHGFSYVNGFFSQHSQLQQNHNAGHQSAICQLLLSLPCAHVLFISVCQFVGLSFQLAALRSSGPLNLCKMSACFAKYFTFLLSLYFPAALLLFIYKSSTSMPILKVKFCSVFSDIYQDFRSLS